MIDSEMDNIEIEDHIIAHQRGLIRAEYGEEQEHNANYGWGIREDPQIGPIVETKVYGPRMVITTSYSGGSYIDSWEPL